MTSILSYWLPVLVASLLWTFLSTPAHQNIDLVADSSSNILLLTAHPDDECMFFAPTLLALQETLKPPPTLYSLCLSVGNADGLGDVRRHELAASLDVLGIGEGRRWVLDHPELQDNFTAEWDPDLIAEVLKPYVLDHQITSILTFDDHGISSHPNHISLPKGVLHLLGSLPAESEKPRPSLYTLTTVPLLEKYLGLLSPLITKASLSLSPLWNVADASADAGVVAVSSWSGYLRAHQAMRQHWSQLVWFRWLYVSFSRYMWVNDWVEVIPTSDAQTASSPEP
ncbi:LmbE-like protein [Earliella scabrosa]|nr:LmbE-like protein [Earliella scabrosa]